MQMDLFELPPTFDLERGEAEKERGMARAEWGRDEWKAEARGIAFDYAGEHGTVNVDDIAQVYAERGINIHDHLGMAMGGVLAHDGRFVWTGRMHKITQVQAHARRIMVWRIKGDADESG